MSLDCNLNDKKNFWQSNNVFVFSVFIITESAHGVRFINDTKKSITISSTAIKRRPALPITPASAPQVLSPKRLCATSPFPASSQIISILPHFINTDTANAINNHNLSLNNHHHHHTQNLLLNTTSAAAPAVISTSTISTNTTNGPVATANIMDNTMGQMTPMANNALVLSQSMDSVNTASNEEEVSWISNFFKLNFKIIFGNDETHSFCNFLNAIND